MAIDIITDPEEQMQDLYNQVDERWRRAKNNKTEFDAQCDKVYKQYASWSQRSKMRFHNNVDVPLGFKIIEALVPMFASRMPDPGCKPRKPQDTDKAFAMNAQLKNYIQTPQKLMELIMFIKSMLLYGIGVIKDGWEYKTDLHKRWVANEMELLKIASLYQESQVFAAMGDIETIKQMAQVGMIPGIEYDTSMGWFTVYDVDITDAPTFKTIFPKDFCWLGNGSDIQKMEAVYHEIYYTKHQIKQMIKNPTSHQYFNLQQALEQGSEEPTSIAVLESQILLRSAESDSIKFVEETRRDTNGLLIITTICPTAEIVVGQRVSPYFHNKFNFSVIRSFPKQDEFPGIPILIIAQSLLATVNKLCNEILDNGSLAMNNVFITRKGKELRDRQLNIFAGLVLPGRKEDWSMLDMKDVRASTMKILEMFIGFLVNVSGVVDLKNHVFQANPQSPGDIEQMQFFQTARGKVQHYIDLLGLTELIERMASNIQQFVRSPVEIKVRGEDNREMFMTIAPSDVAGQFDFEIDVKSMQATNNSVEKAQLQSLLNFSLGLRQAYQDPKTGITSPRMVANIKKLYKEVLSKYDSIDNPNDYVANPESPESLPPEMLPPPPEAMPPEPPPQMQMGQGGQPGGNQPAGMPPQGAGKLAAQMATATGTRGMPPVLGGGQQPGTFRNMSVALPKNNTDAIRSARTIQQ